ncbi:MAG: SRSO17 transposase [Flammeovirgaceae bacterium]
MPKCWTDDKNRCKKEGIPLENQAYKTKPELALEMTESMADRVAYDWIGGDSIYGNSTPLRKGWQKLDKLFVMDIGENFQVHLQNPKPYVPVNKSGGGKKKNAFISESKPLKVKNLLANIGSIVNLGKALYYSNKPSVVLLQAKKLWLANEI